MMVNKGEGLKWHLAEDNDYAADGDDDEDEVDPDDDDGEQGEGLRWHLTEEVGPGWTPAEEIGHRLLPSLPFSYFSFKGIRLNIVLAKISTPRTLYTKLGIFSYFTFV